MNDECKQYLLPKAKKDREQGSAPSFSGTDVRKQ